MIFSALVNLCLYIGLNNTVFLRPTSDLLQTRFKINFTLYYSYAFTSLQKRMQWSDQILENNTVAPVHVFLIQLLHLLHTIVICKPG